MPRPSSAKAEGLISERRGYKGWSRCARTKGHFGYRRSGIADVPALLRCYRALAGDMKEGRRPEESGVHQPSGRLQSTERSCKNQVLCCFRFRFCLCFCFPTKCCETLSHKGNPSRYGQLYRFPIRTNDVDSSQKMSRLGESIIQGFSGDPSLSSLIGGFILGYLHSSFDVGECRLVHIE